MIPNQGTEHRDEPTQAGYSIDGMLYDGLDPLADWRLHMREQTMARQAAERRYALRSQAIHLDGAAADGAARSRVLEFRAELSRISAEHWTWMREHMSEVADRPRRKRKTSPA